MDSIYSTINIYDNLKLKYREYLKPQMVSIALIQTEDAVWLESIEAEITEDGLEKQTIRRINLDFISDDDEGEKIYFDPKESIENNARKFIDEFSPYSIINTTDLFSEGACEKVNKKFNIFGIDR